MMNNNMKFQRILKDFRLIIIGLGICFLLNGCVKPYRVTVDNQKGGAEALSKNDIIQVELPHYFSNYFSDGYSNRFAWGDISRKQTEQKLKQLGFSVINTEDNTTKSNVTPTVVALVEAVEIKGSKKIVTPFMISKVAYSYDPLNPPYDATWVDRVSRDTFLKITLIRPQGKNNPLSYCDDSASKELRDFRFCLSPENFQNYTTIFSGYAKISANSSSIYENSNRLIESIFYNYPNMIGKKWVYFEYPSKTPNYAAEPKVHKTNK